MKKIRLLIVCLGLMLSSQGFSQVSHEIGVQGGVGLRYFLGYSYSTPTSGGVLGLSYQINIKDFFSVLTEVNYELKGQKWGLISIDPEYPNPNVYENFHFLTLPILAKFQTTGKHKFFVTIGPYFGYMLDAKFFIKDGPPEFSQTEQNFVSYYDRFDFGVNGGLGASFSISKSWSIPIEVRYGYSLMGNIYNGPSSRGWVNYQPFNTVFLSVGARYRIGK